MAEIWMVFGAEEYKYGTYRFVTRAEKNRVNDLAMQIRKERGCETYVKEMEEMYKQIEKSLKLKYQRLYNERKITKRERYQMYRHDVNKTFSERYGLEYGYETYE